MAAQPNAQPKAPRLFPPTVARKRFERRILKRVALREERSFLLELYELDEAGERYSRPEELTAEQARRLKTIAAAVRHNRGVLQPVKLALLGVIAGAGVVFVLFFADNLIEYGATRGLESLFGARVEFGELRVRPLEPGFSFTSLAVADRNRPFRNLFELGYTELRFDLGQLLRGKLVARTIETQEIRWGTERERSGALPPERLPAPRETDDPALEIPQVDELLADRFSDIDPEALVRSHYDALETPVYLAALARDIEDAIDRYQAEVPRLEARARSAAERAEEVADIRPAELRSVEAVRDAYRTVESAYHELDGGVEEVQRIRAELHEDAGRYRDEFEQVSAVVRNDVAYLRDLVPEFDFTDASAIAAFVLPELYEPLSEQYQRIRTVWDAIDRLRARERPDPPDAGRVGRTIEYPARDYPRVLFERIQFSVGERAARDLYELTVAAVSSEPPLVDDPTTVRFARYDGEREIEAGGILDMRGGSAEELEITSAMSGFEFSLGRRSGIVSIEEAAGLYDLETDLRLPRSGAPRGAVRLGIEELALEVPEDDTIASLAREILYSVPRVSVDIEFGSDGRVRAHSNLDGPFRTELRGFFEERRNELQQRVEDELERRLQDEISRREDELAELQRYREEIEGYVARVQEYRAEVATLRDRLENRTAELREEAERRVRDAAEEARREAEERAREEAEEARREAEERARDEAERQLDRALDRFR